jgi:uncharacterized membrane protein YhhN
MAQKEERQQQVLQKEDVSLAPLHASNLLYEALVLFLCSSKDSRSDLGEFFCGDSFAVGSGAIVSLVALIKGEADTSMLALQAITWYHFLNFFLHLRRVILHGGDMILTWEWLSVVTLANIVFLLVCMGILIQRHLIDLDVLFGLSAGGMFLATHGSVYPHFLLRAIVKAIPVCLMARRTYLVKNRDRFTTLIAIGLFICCIADFALEYDFLIGLGLFLCGHLLYVAAFVHENKVTDVTKALPLGAYGVIVYFILFPKLGSLKAPVAVYVLTITAMLWRASVLGLNTSWGLHVAFGALSFALSDTLIALDKFVKPIDNVRAPILGLYWLGQALIAKGVMLRHDQIFAKVQGSDADINQKKDT